jgi:hypothetical protein
VTVLQVLEQLPEGLVMAILTASAAGIEHHLSVLPSTLHPLAIEVAFPSIRRDRSLALDFTSLRDPCSACTLLHAATAATTEASALQEVELKHIPLTCSERLLQLMSTACRSASDVRLDFRHLNWEKSLFLLNYAPSYPKCSSESPLVHLNEALSHNSVLTSLQLTFEGDPVNAFNFDLLIESCAGLQSLTLSSDRENVVDDLRGRLPARTISKLCCLTHLCLGPGLHLLELPQILPHLSRLQELRLQGKCELEDLWFLHHLTALRILELRCAIPSTCLASPL